MSQPQTIPQDNTRDHAFQPSGPVLVTGATGFTGQRLVEKLLFAGASVRAIARASSNREILGDATKVEWFVGDVFDPDTVARAAEGVHHIFHVAACFREAKYGDEQYWNVHVKSTQLLAEAASRNPDFRRFIHVSTMGVHGHIEHPPGDESSPFAPGDIYQRTKLEAEQWLIDFSARENLPYTIIRPTAIYGPGDRRLLKIFRMAAKPVFVLLGPGKCLYHLVHVDDLADAMLVAATHPAALGEAFLVGHDAAIPVGEMAEVISETLGRKTRFVRFPVTPFFWAAAVCEAICLPLKIEPPLHRRRVAFYTKDRSFSTAKMRDVLGFTCGRTVREGIISTTQWYREQGWLK